LRAAGKPVPQLPRLGLSTPSFPRSAFDAGGVSLPVARSQGLALLGAFETYRTLIAQLEREYKTAAKL